MNQTIKRVECLVNYNRETSKAKKDVDIRLLENFANFMKKKGIVRSNNELLARIDEFKHFLSNFEDEVQIDLLYPGDPNGDYMERIRTLEKQGHSVQLVKQIFKSIEPFGLSEAYLKYFRMLKHFQEASFKYQQAYRDHLIHSLRVFLLIISILKTLDEVWIDALKKFFCSSIGRFARPHEVNPQLFLKFISERELWEYSIHAVFILSFFHDIGLVYSGYEKMNKGLSNKIFAEDISLFTYEMKYKLKSRFKDRKSNTLSTFKKVIERLHPKYTELVTILREELEKIEKMGESVVSDEKKLHQIIEKIKEIGEDSSVSDEKKLHQIIEKIKEIGEILSTFEKSEKTRGSTSVSNEKKLHGALALLNTYTFKEINDHLLDVPLDELQKTLEELDKRQTWYYTIYYRNIRARSEPGPKRMFDSSSMETTEDQKDVLITLVLCEAFNAILVHDMEKFPYLSIFAELLIFADNSQEWDRIEYEEGKKKRPEEMVEQVQVCVDRCSKADLWILSFCERAEFGSSSSLNELVDRWKNRYKSGMGTGRFGVFSHFRAIDAIEDPIRAVFICPYLRETDRKKEQETKRRDIKIGRFCQKCRYPRKVIS